MAAELPARPGRGPAAATRRPPWWLACAVALLLATRLVAQEQPGSLRGVVYDKDFDVPLAGALVKIIETGQQTTTSDLGNFVISDVPPGLYTVLFSKDGYVRQVKPEVEVRAGQLTDLNVSLPGEFTEMDEFVVHDVLQTGAGTESALLALRLESPSFMDSIGAELMSRAGASDAASGLRLVSGASLQDGKSAVIRGLPDRYVSSQLNGVRLPTTDEDKRAVELDQFPAVVIESIQVSKTFTPDQQGDASGGAVNVKLKSIPEETVLLLNGQISQNSQVAGSDGDFLTYDGGGIDFLGKTNSDKHIQSNKLGDNWDGAAGVKDGDAPTDYKWSAAAGGKHELGSGVKIGGLASIFYERDSAFYDDGTNDSLWVATPGAGLSPQTFQGTPAQGDFKTALFDVTKASQLEKWGGLGTFGVESDRHAVNLTYLYSQITEDTATLAEDTRGKEFFFPGYDPNDPSGTGNEPSNLNAAPYLRTETLAYTERKTQTLQLDGRHTLPMGDFGGSSFRFHAPEVEWLLAKSSADLNQPDKRQFGSLWLPASFNPGVPPFIPPFTTPPTWFPYKPAENFNLGNLQRIFKEINEDSDEYSLNLKLPFTQWTGDEGYLKTGVFDDHLERKFHQETFSNFGDAGAFFLGDFDDFWSDVFPNENHPISAANTDVDYDGEQDISAWYGMFDLPFNGTVKVIGGVRYERTHIGVVNDPEAEATWFPPGSTAPVTLNPGDADVEFDQRDALPSIGLVVTPNDQITVRGSYSQTVARQTFKELTPILQQEFLGGPIFIGNPDLQMSSLENYDLRLDYAPYEGGLVSVSKFTKKIEDPIEYVQKLASFTYTTAVNYPKGEIDGYELEVRQALGQYAESLQGLALGANATFIDSEVDLPADEIAGFSDPGIQAPMTSRDMTNAPEHLYNLYVTYDLASTGTQFALFYTIAGDTLIAGAGQSDGNLVPNVYAKEYGTLNLSVSQKLTEHATLQFQAKNLTDPSIETFYQSDFIAEDTTKSSFKRGREFSLGVSIRF